MTAAAAHEPLLPEEADAFDCDYRQALKAAAETLSLDELHKTLEHRRRVARMTQADPSAHRRMHAQAEQTLRTGQLPAGTMPADEIKAIIRRRLGL